MNKLFDLDSPIMQFLSRMADLVVLSFLWFVCCLPIITIGPATAAMYYVTLKLTRKEEVQITQCFFQGFKSNFKQGVIMNLIFIVVGVILAWDYLIMLSVEGTYGLICCTSFLVMEIWMLCIMFYAYPLQAQFYNTIRRTLMNAAILSMRKFLSTVMFFALNMLPVIVAFISLPVFVKLAPVWVLLTPGLSAYLCSMRLNKLFEPYLKPAEKEQENTEIA